MVSKFAALVTALVSAAAFFPHPALSQSAQDIAAQLPGLAIKPGKDNVLILGGDFRPVDFRSLPSGFELSQYTNGVDDDLWPLEKMIAGLATRICGQVAESAARQQIERLYKSKSLTKSVELGGNAGATFKRRLTAKLGSCNISYNAEGARWHTITVNVVRP